MPLLAACGGPLGDVSRQEINRALSPDGRVEAVLVESNGGATTSFGYSVFLVPKGIRTLPDPEHGVFVADHIDSLRLVWREPRLLELRYREARIFRFTNFWHAAAVDSFRYVVELRLQPSSDQWSLSRRDRWLE